MYRTPTKKVRYSQEMVLDISKFTMNLPIVFMILTFFFLKFDLTELTSQALQYRPRVSVAVDVLRGQVKNGKRSGLHARLKVNGMQLPLPSLLLTNIRELENKLDELSCAKHAVLSLSRKPSSRTANQTPASDRLHPSWGGHT